MVFTRQESPPKSAAARKQAQRKKIKKDSDAHAAAKSRDALRKREARVSAKAKAKAELRSPEVRRLKRVNKELRATIHETNTLWERRLREEKAKRQPSRSTNTTPRSLCAHCDSFKAQAVAALLRAEYFRGLAESHGAKRTFLRYEVTCEAMGWPIDQRIYEKCPITQLPAFLAARGLCPPLKNDKKLRK